MRSIKIIATFCAFVMVLGVAATQVSATTYYLNTSNEAFVNNNLSGPFASVDLTVTGHTATFTIDPIEAAFNGTGNNFGVARFLFNTGLSSITASDFSLVSGWTVNAPGGSPAGFGTFELNYTDTQSVNRQNPLTFTITDDAITSESDFFDINSPFHFLAHITDFSINNDPNNPQITSAWFADSPPTTNNPVPEPGTIFLLGSGLLGLGVFGKKRMKG